MRRVVRLSNFTPRRLSRVLICLLTRDLEVRNALAAAEKLLVSTTLAKVIISFSRSIFVLSRHQIVHIQEQCYSILRNCSFSGINHTVLHGTPIVGVSAEQEIAMQ